mmetsp:Transcript_10800/g.30401  ORF Transcript_10800/g.30401 Transcript_10800/m.30401 type:complete len:197 (-) Transcript_10800:116-706(-)
MMATTSMMMTMATTSASGGKVGAGLPCRGLVSTRARRTRGGGRVGEAKASVGGRGVERALRLSGRQNEGSLLVCRATTDEPETEPEQAESGGEKRKVLKNVFYVAAAIALPIVGWSEVVTATTGEGLQGAFLGALEGVSYLVLLGVIGKSIALKVRTGTGFPPGPYGLLGALEGLAYLELVGLIVSQILKAKAGGV